MSLIDGTLANSSCFSALVMEDRMDECPALIARLHPLRIQVLSNALNYFPHLFAYITFKQGGQHESEHYTLLVHPPPIHST